MSTGEHIAAAEALLRTDPPAHLRYAALELRLAIEVIAYEKLRLYAPRLPASVLAKWQPPQAFRALEEYEPGSTQSFRLRIARETEYGVAGNEWHDMGEHRAFKLNWLRKTYNKLGSLIHHRAPGFDGDAEVASIADPDRLRAELRAILAEVARVASSQIHSSIVTVFEFHCVVCGAPILRNEKGARETERADCLQRECGAQHHVAFTDHGAATVQLIATAFECVKCGTPLLIQNRHLDIGYRFTCARCGVQHVVATRNWGYGIPDANPPNA